MPYNYVMDRNVVGIYEKVLNNSILVIDEAHNIQNVAMDGASMTLKMNMIELGH
jgi:Rad3-related DNA helicase